MRQGGLLDDLDCTGCVCLAMLADLNRSERSLTNCLPHLVVLEEFVDVLHSHPVFEIEEVLLLSDGSLSASWL